VRERESSAIAMMDVEPSTSRTARREEEANPSHGSRARQERKLIVVDTRSSALANAGGRSASRRISDRPPPRGREPRTAERNERSVSSNKDLR